VRLNIEADFGTEQISQFLADRLVHEAEPDKSLFLLGGSVREQFGSNHRTYTGTIPKNLVLSICSRQVISAGPAADVDDRHE
jgi:hypothetical protein